MNFAFSEEQEELRKSVRRFLEDKSPSPEVRRLMETDEGYDPAVWDQMGQQLGLQGLAIPEEYGGSGYSYVELIVVLEEMGRALLPAPVLLDRGPGRQRHPRARATTPPRRSSCPASPRARPSPPWPSPRTAAAGTRTGITMEATKSRRRLHARPVTRCS